MATLPEELLYPDGLGLSQGWEPPDHWFDAPAPEMDAGGVPPAPAAEAQDDWVPDDWYQPQALEPVQQFIGQPSPQQPLPYQAPAALEQRAPMPFEADVVTGGQTQPVRDERDPVSMGDLLTPGQSTAEAGQERADDLMALSPEQRAAAFATQDADKERRDAASRLDAVKQIDDEFNDVREVHAKREIEINQEREQIRGDLARLAKEGINNDHWWGTRDTGQKVASYVTAIIGGLLAPHRGGRNTGIEFIMDAINQDIETQKANLQHRRAVLGERRGLVGDLAAQNGDLLRSADTVRMAALQTVDARLAAEASQYDPAGVTARRIAEARGAVQEKLKQEAMAAEEKLYQRGKDKAEFELRLRAERRQAAAQRHAAKANEREEARYQSEHGVVFDPKTGRYEVDPTAPKPAMKLSDQKTALEIEEKVRGSQVHDSRGQLIGVARRGVEGAKEMAADVSGYEEFRTALADLDDRIAATVQKYGGLGSDRWKPEDVAAIEALHKPIVFKLARAMNGPGPLSKADVDAAEASVPTLDTWTTSRKPRAVYEAMVQKADTELNKRLGVQLEGFNEAKSPTERYRAMDKLKDKPTPEAPREKLLERASQPITSLSKGDPDIRAAALEGRAKVLDELRDRKEGLSEEDVSGLRGALDTELAQGDLSKEEHARLVEYLEVKGGMGQRRRLGREYTESISNAGTGPRVGQRR